MAAHLSSQPHGLCGYLRLLGEMLAVWWRRRRQRADAAKAARPASMQG